MRHYALNHANDKRRDDRHSPAIAAEKATGRLFAVSALAEFWLPGTLREVAFKPSALGAILGCEIHAGIYRRLRAISA